MATKKKRPVNYLNNANLMEQIKASKEILTEAQKKDPDVTPASCMTDELVKMLMMLVERYSKKANWRGYTYIDDMRSEATVSLLNGALKFNPEVGQNPFGYYTQIVHHSFLTTLEKEKKARNIRDDLLEQHGFSPSNTRQLENESGRMERIEQEFYEADGDVLKKVQAKRDAAQEAAEAAAEAAGTPKPKTTRKKRAKKKA